MDLYQTYRRDLLDIHKSINDHLTELTKHFEKGTAASASSTAGSSSVIVSSNGAGTITAPAVTGAKAGGAAASATAITPAARIAAIVDLVQQGKTCLSHMEMEANDLIPAERINVRGELSDHKKRLAKYDVEIVNMRQKLQQSEREELLRGSGGGSSSANGLPRPGTKGYDPNAGIPDDLDEQSKKERRALASVTEKQRGNTDIMNNIERIAVNSNALLKDAHGNLVKQRETLTHIDETTRELDADVSDARRIANQMHKVMVKNKAILLGIIGLLVVMIIVIIYVKAVGSGTTTETKVVVVLPTSPAGDTGNGGGGLDM